MPTITRRRFLQFAGISLAGTALHPFSFLPEFADQPPVGRTFAATPVYAAADVHAPIITRLWPDHMVTLLDESGGWYRTNVGYVRRESIQPMLPYHAAGAVDWPEAPFWAEVAAPNAPIVAWCAADAPAVTRIGHGGVVRIIDTLPRQRESGAWIGLEAENGQFLGWSQAVYWRPVYEPVRPTAASRLEIDPRSYQLRAVENDRTILTAAFASGGTFVPGEYAITRRQMSLSSLKTADSGLERYGIPWMIEFGGKWQICGVYWHHDTGTVSGPAVQITPLLARWLYAWMSDSGLVVVV